MSIPRTCISGCIGLASCGSMSSRLLHSLWLIEVEPHKGRVHFITTHSTLVATLPCAPAATSPSPSVEKANRYVLMSTATASVGSVRRLHRALPLYEPYRGRGGRVAWPSGQLSFVRSEPLSASNPSTWTRHADARCWSAPW